VVAKWDFERSSGEFGIGGHMGWFATTVTDSLLQSRALAASARFTMTRFVELRGEAFIGQALASLGGGGIGQDLGPGDKPIRTRGGWGQLNLLPHPAVELGGGFGMDDPDNSDVAPTGRFRNIQWEGHLHFKPGPLIIAVEFRRVETTYSDLLGGKLYVNHLNVATGFRF